MAAIKKFDKANLKTVRADIDAALAAVAKKHGIKLSIGGITYDPDGTNFRTTLSAVTEAAAGGADVAGNVKWQSAFIKYAALFGMKKEDLGKKVKIGRETYTIVGARPKANMPIVLQKATGGFIAYGEDAVKAALSA